MKSAKAWVGMLLAAVAVPCGASATLAGPERAATRGMQKLVFDANGGTCKTGYDYYTQGEPYTFLPEAVWDGHEFLGWFTAASGGVQVTEAQTVTAEAERTLYAHWTSPAVDVTWEYTVSNGQAELTGAFTSEGNLVVPSSLGGYPVTSIGYAAFSGCSNLVSVTIPACVTNFAILSSLSEAVNAFDSYASMYPTLSFAFEGCSGLVDIHVSGDNPVYASEGGVLFTKDRKTLLFCPNGKTGTYSVPDGVLQIGDGEAYHGHYRYVWGWPAFAGCSNLAKVAIPDGVRVIDDRSFEDCRGLTSVVVPDSVTNIGVDAFSGCSGLTAISVGSGVEKSGECAFWGCSGLTAVHIHDLAAWCKISFYRWDGYANPLSYAHHLFLDGKEVTDLVIPSGVTSIPAWAFSCCSGLTKVTIPSSVTSIGRRAFSGCNGLASVTIPDSVTVIGDYAFYGCSGLKTLHVPASWNGTSMLDGAAVPEGCNVVYASLALGAGERTFTADAASGKLLEVMATVSWTAKSNVPWLTVKTSSGSGNGNIEYDVAANTGTGSRTGTITVSGGGLTLAFTVTQDGKAGGGGTTDPPTMQKLVFDANGGNCNTPWDWYTVGQPYTYLPEAARSGYVFAGWFTAAGGGSQVTEVQTVTAVAERTLYAHWASSAVEISWEYTVSNGQAELAGASPAEGNLVIPSSLGGYPVTRIGSSAFDGCSGLASVTLPNTVTNIAWNAFYGCSGLKSIAVAADHPVYAGNDGALFTKDGKTLVRCPGGKTGAYSIPSGVTGIGYYAFLDCEGLTSVAIPSSVTYMADSAFFECVNLASVTIPNGVTNIGNYMFYLCRNLKSVTIPGSVTRIGNSAFHECNSLAGIRIPDSVASIGYYAFEGCNGLASLTIPASVTSLGQEVFAGCGGLKTLYVPASWKGTSMLAGAAVPEGCKVVYVSLALAASERTFTAAAAISKELEVTANVAWTVTSSVSWLALRTEGCSGNGTIVYDVAANTGTSSRTGTITVAGGGLTRTFTVTQSGYVATLQLGANERTFTADAANGKLLEVTATVSWTAKSSASWLTVKTASGSGNGNIEYAVAANTGAGSRTGTITVSGGGLARTFTVTQEGKTVTLVLGAESRTFTADAASGKLLAVTANVPWTAKSSASWLAVKTTSGSGSGNIEYAVAANTGLRRTGTITVSGGGLVRTFTVSQEGGKSETQEAPVGVPCGWLETNAAGILAANGGDYEAAAKASAANGKAVWECYVAGLDTTNATAEFKVKSISVVDGKTQVQWEPDLNEGGTRSNRAYTVEGKKTMAEEWGTLDDSSRFFRVRVGMPAE